MSIKAASAQHRPVRFDQGRFPRASLGFLLTAADRTAETDVMRMLPPGVGAHFSRIAMPREVTLDGLAALAAGLSRAASLILPEEKLDVVCFACTSGSIVIGEERVCHEIQHGAPQARATSLITGVTEALRHIGARRIVVATPYLDEVNRREHAYLTAQSFDVLDIQGLNLVHEEDMARVAPDFLAEFAQSVDRADADAIFISCGALRSIEILDQCEAATGKPVICSNQAMMWHCLRLANIHDRIAGHGSLLN